MKNKFWNFKATDTKGELYLYGDISDYSWSGDEITPKQFKSDLDSLGDITQLDIYINSPGGDVFAGQAIYTMLNRHKAYKTVYIDGLAASIASVVAMAGDKVVMPKNAMMMIHKAWSIMMGNSTDMRKIADDMDKMEESIVAVYQAKTGLETDKINEIMAAETWLTAEDALSYGFIDEIEKAVNMAAKVKDTDLSKYKNSPRFIFEEVPPIEEAKEPTEEEIKNKNNDNALKSVIFDLIQKI